MDYKSRTAEELANGYLKECKNITMMRYLTFIVFLFLLIRFWTKVNFLICVAFVIVFYMALQFLQNMKVQQFSILQQVLREDCDAAKYAEIMKQVLEKSKQDGPFVHLCYIQGLYTSGRFQEASEELEKVYIKRADIGIHLLYQHLAFDCRVKQGDNHAAHQARQDTYQLMGNVKPKQRPMIENTLHVMDSCLALAEARYEDFYALEERVQAEAANQLQLVSSAFRMGKADLATGNLDGAKEHFEDVIAEGNTLYMANGARQLLADMVPAELPASAED